MTNEEYEQWCRRLSRCPATGKVSWPIRSLAEMAVPVMVDRSDPALVGAAGVYECRVRHGCHLFHITRDLVARASRGQRQRANQPETARIKRARQHAAQRARRRSG